MWSTKTKPDRMPTSCTSSCGCLLRLPTGCASRGEYLRVFLQLVDVLGKVCLRLRKLRCSPAHLRQACCKVRRPGLRFVRARATCRRQNQSLFGALQVARNYKPSCFPRFLRFLANGISCRAFAPLTVTVRFSPGRHRPNNRHNRNRGASLSNEVVQLSFALLSHWESRRAAAERADVENERSS